MQDRLSRRAFLAAAGTAALAGCTGGGSGSGDVATPTDSPASTPRSTPSDVTPAGAESTFTATPSSGAPPTADALLPLPMAPGEIRRKAISGGPPKDGIPSIDDPKFIGADEADGNLEPGDVVFGLARGGVVKAYPQHILVWHEICNDEIGGLPASVTYCPLTGTVQGFWRGGTTFGVSGRLVNNNLIMYDRATELWWPQVLASSVPSPWHDGYRRQSLREFRLVWTTWGRWKGRFPDTKVLSRDTGHARNYGNDPYGSYNPRSGYYTQDTTMFPSMSESDRYHAKRIVMGARTPDGAVAFLKDALRKQGLMEGSLGGTPVLAVYDRGLDTGYVYRNPDRRSFDYEGGVVVGPDGARHHPSALDLGRIHAFDAMWFAWSGFYPGTNVYE